MINIQPLDLTKPQPDVVHLTYPRYRWRLMCEEPPHAAQFEGLKLTDAFVACIDDRAVGLALLDAGSPQHSRLLSVMVAKPIRSTGVGLQLIAAIEKAARVRGATQIEAHFLHEPARDPFRALMRSAGWTAPVPLNFRLAGRADWTTRMGADWPRFMNRMESNGFSTTPWASIDAADREKADVLVAEQAGNEVIISYKGCEDFCDEKLSIAIRKNGELVGFIHGESLQQNDFHYYSTGYVSKPLQRAGWLIAGLDDVCRRQAVEYGPESLAIYETYGTNTRMIDFMRRRLGPVFTWMKERHKVQKSLI
ncbi:GNAT family N-acetyltransferase [Puniceibacterium sediminis]|uniref:Acetyltransferase (GNAT) family protein n=1 Tax=Puniceibacterium sediminis TaxID=1608407 RepID=A0A238ZUD6_9RHOB|nr:GNAT family N-acetyltransferase [Puniceibacterium sediminis]SNR87037.1 Acetyltransferase (GNAT) family protein [Puniceibacterium sediminis]